MPSITVSEETFRRLDALRGSLDWDEFFNLLTSDINTFLRRLGKELDEDFRRLDRWR